MAATYAALLSLNFMIDQIQHSSLKKKPHLQTLQEKITELQKFLEDYSQGRSQEMQDLEKNITVICHATEDAIESHVLDQFLVKSGDNGETSSTVVDANQQKVMEGIESTKFTDVDRDCEAEDVIFNESHDVESSSLFFPQYLQKVMAELDSIKEKATQMMDVKTVPENQPPKSYISGGPTKSARVGENSTMVGFDDHLINIKKMLTSQESDLRVLPIVGMGGLGKTTLARNVCDDKLINEHFETHLWCTISQSYDVRDIFLRFLHDLGIFYETDTEPKSNNELGDKLYQTLSGRKYLIVLDDVWSTEVWDPIKRYLPNDGHGGRVLVTTRRQSVASYTGSCQPYLLGFLNEEESWRLLNEKVHLQNGSPLENLGRKIASSCKGLPLAIVVTGGLLAKSNMTQESWEYIAEALNSIVSSEDDGYCHNILYLSYDNLPVHLKPCFLFMGVFPEDSEVRVSTLVKLLVAEGFVKGIEAKCLEESAMEYVKDLVERNLIIVGKLGFSGKFKSIRIHDLVRDLCLKEAKKHNFLCIKRFHGFHIPITIHNLPGIKAKHNNGIYRTVTKDKRIKSLYPTRSVSTKFSSLELLRELNVADVNSPEKNLLLTGSRCLTFSAGDAKVPLDSLPMLWNVQSMIVKELSGNEPIVLPREIWEMPLVRHLEIPKVVLKNPDGETHHVLENMQTLEDVINFNFSLDVQKRIPNLKKLKLTYEEGVKDVEWPFPDSPCEFHLAEISKLESLSCTLRIKMSKAHMSFPASLKKLTLDGGEIPWEDMTIVCQLPNLVVLRLHNDAFVGEQWATADQGKFEELKWLHLENLSLENWETESSHFRKLERLSFCNIWGLKDIKPCFEDSNTLELMSFEFCSTCLVNSAKQIKDEQESMGNTNIQVKEQLTCDTKDQLVVKLEEELRQLRTILANLMDAKQSKLARKIQHLIYDAEDISDIYVIEQSAGKLKRSYFMEFSRPRGANRLYDLYQIAKDVEFELDQFEENKVHSTNLTVAHGGGGGHRESNPKTQNVVGFVEEAEYFINLLNGHSEKLEIASIVGMAGLGKTTLAWKIFEDSRIKYEFPIRIWVKISDNLNMKKVLITILEYFTANTPDERVEDLIKQVREHLRYEKYFIVMDDIWTLDAWYQVQNILPRANNMGKVLVTTRHKDVATAVTTQTGPHCLRFLTSQESWELLQFEVFGELNVVPGDLVSIGKIIANDCDGLPLSIVVIGGISMKIKSRLNLKAEWKKVSKRVSAYLVGGDEYHILSSIISYSYQKLPYELMNCFLYLGVYPEDADIPVKEVIRLWVAESFIQERGGKSMEQVALDNLNELINRNLVMVKEAKLSGEPKICGIHNSVREVCKAEASYVNLNLFQEINTSVDGFLPYHIERCRRLSIHSHVLDFLRERQRIHKARSFLCFHESPINLKSGVMLLGLFGLLRVYNAKSIKFPRFPRRMFRLIHLRYLTLAVDQCQILPELITELQSLQTLILDTSSSELEMKADIWKMKQLRHLKTNVAIHLRGDGKGDGGEKLQTLSKLSPDSCTPENLNKARNLITLGVMGDLNIIAHCKCLGLLDRLNKLKLVNEGTSGSAAENPLRSLPDPQDFPAHVKIIVLTGTYLEWNRMEVLSRLGFLEVLKLKENALRGHSWDSVGGGFHKLQQLHIVRATELVSWTAMGDPFPTLRFLILNDCENLLQVPPALFNSTLETLYMERASRSAVSSAEAIWEGKKKEGVPSFKLDIAPADKIRYSRLVSPQ